MNVTISRREVGDVVILDIGDVNSRIAVGQGGRICRDAIRDEMALKPRGLKLLLNMKNVVHMDDSSIVAFFSAHVMIENAKGQLKLMNLTKPVRDRMQLTNLYGAFKVYDNEAAALASFGVAVPPAPAPGSGMG